MNARLGAEDLRVGLEAHRGAAPVRRAAELLQLALRHAALERHARRACCPRATSTSSRSDSAFDDRDADAVQAARGLVDLGVEFAARVQRAHDDFERGLLRELRMRIDRDAAAVVGHGHEAVGVELRPRSSRRGRRAPRPSRCRSPRRTGDAAPSRRCRRYTCRGGGAPARALPAPRCRARCSRRLAGAGAALRGVLRRQAARRGGGAANRSRSAVFLAVFAIARFVMLGTNQLLSTMPRLAARIVTSGRWRAACARR